MVKKRRFVDRIVSAVDYYVVRRTIERVGEVFFNTKSILNSGERYDPRLAFLVNDRINYKCHLSRYEFAKNLIGIRDNVTDIACGTGYGTAILSDKCMKITGVDLSSHAIKYAIKNNNRSNIRYIISDIFKFNEISNIVVSFETIEHVHADSLNDVFNKLNSIAKNKIIGSYPYKETPSNNQYHCWFDLDESALSILSEYGKLTIYYQTSDGNIYKQKPIKERIQNIVFEVSKG